MKQKQLLRTLLAALCLLVGTSSVWADATWTFKDNTAVWAGDGVTLSGGNQYDKDAKATPSGGVTFTGTSGFVSTAKGIGFKAVGSTSNENISIVVPAGYKATVSIFTSNNRTVVGDFGGITQTYNAAWATTTKEFDNKEGATPVTLYLYCNQNPGGDNQKQAPFLESITLTDVSSVEAHSWTANAVATINEVKTTIKTYSSTADIDEGSNYTIVVDKVIKYDGNYYELSDAAFSANVFGKSYTMGSSDAEYEYTYVKAADAVFYGEAEDIYSAGSGATKSTGSTLLSNGEGYYASGQNAEYVTLAFNVPTAGYYKISVGMNNTNSSNRGFNYSIDGADASETITVPANSPYVQDISYYLESGDHTLKLNKTYSLTPVFDYMFVRSVPAPEGKFYLKNKANSGYFGAGLNYGTKAITSAIGHTVTLNYSDGKYTIDTSISNGGNNHYLNGVWSDGAAFGWALTSDGAGYYTISDGTNNLTAGAIGAEITLASGTGDNAKWQLLTEAEWKAEQVARLDAATSSNGVDATFYIPAANFNRNDNTENAKWQGSPTINGLSENSANTNYNGQKYNTNPFDVYQELTGLKPGAYKLTAQGFYRNGETNDCNAILYANTVETPLVNIRSTEIATQDNDKGFTTKNGDYYVPNTQTDASKAFNNAYYNNELYVVVGEDGAMRVGVKKSVAAENDWAVFDNFQLTYYGNTVSATITPTGYATFSSPYALDFSGAIDKLDAAYYASAVAQGSVTMTKLEQAVPAETGLFLKGKANETVTIPVVASGTTINGTNYLKPNTTAKEIAASTENAYHYVFAYTTSDGSNPGFFNLASPVTLGAGKAYLETTTDIKPAQSQGAKVSILFFDDNLTGVKSIDASSNVNANADKMYNLGGQLVGEGYKGIVIVNGKKVIK